MGILRLHARNHCNRTETGDSPKAVNKYFRRRTADCDFQYICEWNNCSHISTSMNEFNHHVNMHRRGYTQCLGTDEEVGSGEYVFYCQWQDCNAHLQGQIDDFSRHVFYHTFHQYLKFLGQNIRTLEKLGSCQLDTASRNVIPELPEKLMCRWLDCGMTYDNPYIFYSHVTHHCEEYPKGNYPSVMITCKWEGCTTTTKCWYKMKEHVRSHTQAKIVACPTCGSLFSNNTRFIDHLKRQSLETDLNFECSHCKNRFASERILREHMRHHVNHYKCPLCDMTCHSPSAVRDHVRYRHSQERSFKCSTCDFRAKTSLDLQRHTVCHIKTERLTCSMDGCDKVLKSNLEHCNSHHEVVPKQYECHICSKLFTRGFCLTSHLQIKHNYRWPSGHKRFRYKLHEDGIRRLQTIRYESIEVSQQVLGQQLSPHPTSLQIVGSKSEVVGNDVLTVEDDSSEAGRSSISDEEEEGDKTETAENLTRESSGNVFENLQNVRMDSGNSSSDASKSCSPFRNWSDTDNELNVSTNKKSASLPQGNKSGPADRRRAKKSQALNDVSGLSNAATHQALNDVSGLSNATTHQAEVVPKRSGRKRKKVDIQDLEANQGKVQRKKPGRTKKL